MTGLSSLLLLADGRFPSGGHAHSGGLEGVVAAGLVADPASLASFLRGRLSTSGLVAAAFAAVACARPDSIVELDRGLDARIPSPAQRLASRRQGRATMRAGRTIWSVPSPAPPPDGPHHPVALGVVACMAGLAPEHAALAAAHGAVTGPASAAVRLLGLDPYAVHAVLAQLGPDCDRVAASAAALTDAPVSALPAAGAPLLDIVAETHATWEVRFFAS